MLSAWLTDAPAAPPPEAPPPTLSLTLAGRSREVRVQPAPLGFGTGPVTRLATVDEIAVAQLPGGKAWPTRVFFQWDGVAWVADTTVVRLRRSYPIVDWFDGRSDALDVSAHAAEIGAERRWGWR